MNLSQPLVLGKLPPGKLPPGKLPSKIILKYIDESFAVSV